MRRTTMRRGRRRVNASRWAPAGGRIRRKRQALNRRPGKRFRPRTNRISRRERLPDPRRQLHRQVRSFVVHASVSHVLGRSTRKVLRYAPTSPGEVTGLRAHAPVQAPTHSRVGISNLNRRFTMDIQNLIAQRTGQLPQGFVPQAVIRQEAPRCSQPRCRRPASLKANGGVRDELCAVPDSKSEILQAAEGGSGSRRRLPALRLPQAVRRRPSSASGAARIATRSANRSARTPSTPRPSTSSPPSPTASTRRATSTAASRR